MKRELRTNHLPEGEARARAGGEIARIPCAGSFDVVVVGGGTAGAVAAIAAGQEGLKTAVVEPQSFLGGIGTGGGIHSYYHGIQTGVQVAIDERTAAWTRRIGGKASGFHPEAKKLALQELADEAGVRAFYHCFFAGAVMEGGRIVGVAVEGDPAGAEPQGLFWIEARVVIDSSGDADVAAAAGAPFHLGREGDHAPQPYSLAPGILKGPDAVSFRNFDAGYVDPTHALEQSRAQREGRAHLYREQFNAENRMLYVSPILGLRESRFIDAEYVITLADQQAQRRFPDAVARAKAHYDNHAKDYENESFESRAWVAVSGNWHTQMCHDVPYRCLLPKRVENLLVACRAIGLTHDAHQLFRMQRDMQALGEAAAVAAAVAIRSGASVREVDVRAVQQRLVERGALPKDVLAGEGLGTIIEPDAQLAKASVEALLKTFGGKREPAAWTELCKRGEAIHGLLRAALEHGGADARYLAAGVLALQGKTDGVEVLKETLRARREDAADVHRAGPRWLGALFLLDRLGLRESGSIEEVLDLLNGQPLDIHKAVAAVRALGRHATAAEALEPLRAVLRRRDIEAGLALQHSQGPKGKQLLQDRRFELDLAAAPLLAEYGEPAEARAWVEKHLHDPRALVRSHARKVLAQVAAKTPAAEVAAAS